MKKYLSCIISGIGGGMVGLFANKLNTPIGAVCFTIGVILLVAGVTISSGNKHCD